VDGIVRNVRAFKRCKHTWPHRCVDCAIFCLGRGFELTPRSSDACNHIKRRRTFINWQTRLADMVGGYRSAVVRIYSHCPARVPPVS
jgi:hypothetical protein